MLKGLSGNALKVIAIIAMTIDHLAVVSHFAFCYYHCCPPRRSR